MKPKPCPFCGSSEISAICRARYSRPYGHFVFIKCEMCGAQSAVVNVFDDPDCSTCQRHTLCESANIANETALAKWNTRVGDSDNG